jgi:hypothetical protein
MAMCDYSSGMSWLAPGLFLVGLLLSLPLTAAMIAVGHRLQAMDSQGFAGHLKTLRRVPNVGGVAFVSAFVLPLLGGLLVLSGVLPVDLDRLWQGAGAHAPQAAAAAASAASAASASASAASGGGSSAEGAGP